MDSTIHWINLYIMDNAAGFHNTYPLNNDFNYPVDSAVQHLYQGLFEKFKGGWGMSQGIWEGG